MTFEREKNRSHPLRLLINPFVSRKVLRVALSHRTGAREREPIETEKNKKSLSKTHTRESRPRAHASSERKKKKKKKDKRIEKRTHVSP